MIHDVIRLMRPQQWYKNLVVFLPVVFAGLLGNVNYVLLSGFAFVILCAVSSANYVINDIIDRKEDRANPEKANRPIASGKVSVASGIFLAAFLFLGGIIWSMFLGKTF